MIAACIFGVLTVSLLAALSFHLRDVNPKILRAQITFTESAFRAVVQRWSADQLTKVRTSFALDYALLIAYGGLGFSLATALLQRSALPGPFVAAAWPWVLPAAAVCDALENALHQHFLRSAPSASPAALFALSGCAASIKWMLALVYFLLFGIWAIAKMT